MSELGFVQQKVHLKEQDYQGRPDLKIFKKRKPIEKMRTIFRILTDDLILFFDEKNYKVPDNHGECR